MKKRFFILGMITMLIVVIAIPNTFASGIQRSIEVVFNKVNVKLNDELVGESGENYQLSNGTEVPFSIVYEGTTYMAVRKLSETLGLDVGWDGETSTVLLTSKAPVEEEIPETNNSTNYGTRSNPVKPSERVIFNYTDFFDTVYEFEAEVLEIIRGDEANKVVAEVNSFNDPPSDGYEYMLVKFDFKVNSSSEANKQYDLSESNFTLISEDGKDYDINWEVTPTPKLDANLYEGASHIGYVLYEVAVDDLNPLIAFGRKYDGSGGVWFSINVIDSL